jgi:signal transduction histidine kinase
MNREFSVLVVDDEPDNFDVIEILLHDELYQLHYAPSGKRALDRLHYFQPDIILLDVMMPDLDGIEVCRQIKAMPQWQSVPIVMVTALTTKEDLARCLAAGADDFISKPVDGLELRARVRSMLRIKQQYDNLQSLLKLRDDLVNMIVHDLRHPLASIVFLIHILQHPQLPAEKQQLKFDQMTAAVQQLESMIDSLLLTAKLEAGKMRLDYSPIDLCALCTSAIVDFQAIAAQKNLTLIGQLPKLGGSLQVDIPLIRRVIDNLLSNAIKFSPSHSEIILRAEYLEMGGANIQVVDCGLGVSEDLRQKIFEKYEVGTLIQDITQIGLGLAFCKLAIEAHGGKIVVEDNQPRGSIFKVLIPSHL